MALLNTAVSFTIGAALAGSFTSAFQEAASSSTKLGETVKQTNAKFSAASNLMKYQDRLNRLRQGQFMTGLSSSAMELAIGETQRKFNQASAEAHKYGINIGNVVGQQKKFRQESLKLSKQMEAEQMRREGAPKINAGWGSLKGAALGVTAKLAPVMMTTKLAWDFEEQMSGVRAMTQATDEDFQKLTNTARQLGRDTSFSASEAAGGMMLLGQAGFKNNEIIAAMPGLLNMAAAGATSLEETTDIASSALRSFGLEASQMGRVADVLSQTAIASNLDLHDLGESMKYVAPLAKSLNISIEESSAALGVLHDNGIKGSQAGTTLKKLLASLAGPSSKGADAIAALGVETQDAAGNLLPLGEIIDNFSNELADVEGNATKAGYLKDLFGEEALAGASVLFSKESATRLGKFTEELNNCAGAAKRVAETRLDNASGSFKILSSVLSDIGISLGNVLLPPLKLFFDLSSTVLSWVAWALDVVPGLSEIIMGVGGGFLVMSSAIAIWKGVTLLAAGAMQLLNGSMALNPFGAIALVIVAVALIVYNYWEPIADFFIGLWDSIASGASVIWTFIKPMVMFSWTIIRLFTPIGWIIGLVKVVIDHWNDLMALLKPAWEWITFFFMWGNPIGWIIQLFGSLYSGVGSNWEIIKAFCAGFYQKFTEISDLLGSFFETIFDVSPIGMFFAFFTDGIDGMIAKFEKLGEIWKGIKGYFGFGTDETQAVQKTEAVNVRAESALESAQASTPAAIAAKNGETPAQVQNNQSYTIVQRPNEDPEELARRITRIQNDQEAADLRGGFSDYSYA